MTARSVGLHTMWCEARQGFVVVPWCCRVGDAWRSISRGQQILARQPENPGAVHLFVARGDMEWFGRNPVGSISNPVSPREREP